MALRSDDSAGFGVPANAASIFSSSSGSSSASKGPFPPALFVHMARDARTAALVDKVRPPSSLTPTLTLTLALALPPPLPSADP